MAPVGAGGMGIAASDIWTIIHYDLPCMIVVPNNSSWGRNALMGEHIHPNLDWSVGKNNRWDLALEAHGAHGEHVERFGDLAQRSGAPLPPASQPS